MPHAVKSVEADKSSALHSIIFEGKKLIMRDMINEAHKAKTEATKQAALLALNPPVVVAAVPALVAVVEPSEPVQDDPIIPEAPTANVVSDVDGEGHSIAQAENQ